MILDKNTKDFIETHLLDDIRKLALKSDKYPNINMPFALQQISGKQKAKTKLPSWYKQTDILYPDHLAMEQCSSELTALYKVSLLDKGNTFADLTGGFGIDFSFIAPKFEKSIYIEKQTELANIAKHNFKILQLQKSVIIEDDSIQFLSNYDQSIDTIFIDPARRNLSGKKTVLIKDCTPDLKQIDLLLNKKAKTTMIKLSPMLDITQACNIITNISDIHIISVNNECKELLFIKKTKKESITIIHCVNILSNKKKQIFNFTKDEENALQISYTSDIKKYLYEPNSAILKAGAYKSIANRFNIQKLNSNSHLYTSDSEIKDFPGRKFVVEKEIQPNKNEVKIMLKNITQANITTRNYPITAQELKKKLKLKDGGNHYLFATTLSNEKKVLILCQKLS